MNTAEFLRYCTDKADTEQVEHQEWEAVQIKVSGVLFAMIHDVNQRPVVSLKTTPALAALLRDEHSDIFPSEHLNKSCWSTLFLDGSLKDSQIYYLADASYQQAQQTHATGSNSAHE